MHYKQIDGLTVGYTLDYSSPASVQMWRAFERFTQKHLMTILLAVIVSGSLYFNWAMFMALVEARESTARSTRRITSQVPLYEAKVRMARGSRGDHCLSGLARFVALKFYGLLFNI
jgi:hypothetical protein